MIEFAVDCTASGGGNVAAFIRSQCFKTVLAFEENYHRAQQLKHNNMDVLFWDYVTGNRSWHIAPEDFTISLLKNPMQLSSSFSDCAVISDVQSMVFDVVMFDPPWGALNYMQSMKSTLPVLVSQHHGDAAEKVALDIGGVHDHKLSSALPFRTDESHIATSSRMESDYSKIDMWLSHILTHEFTFGVLARRVKLAAVKVPSSLDASALLKIITRPSSPCWEKSAVQRSSRNSHKSRSSTKHKTVCSDFVNENEQVATDTSVLAATSVCSFIKCEPAKEQPEYADTTHSGSTTLVLDNRKGG